MKVKFHPRIFKQLRKTDVRIRNQFKKHILLFAKNPQDSVLNNHELTRAWKGYRSIDITNNFRAVYIEKKIGRETVAYFVAFGTHEDLYS